MAFAKPLRANTFTDVLASVAAQWSPSNDDALPGSWESQAIPVGQRTEGSGSAHGGSYFQVTLMRRGDRKCFCNGSMVCLTEQKSCYNEGLSYGYIPAGGYGFTAAQATSTL